MSLSPTARPREFPRYVFVAKAFRVNCTNSCIFYAWLLTIYRGNKPLPWGLKFRGNKNSIPNAYRGNKHEP